MCLFSVAVFFPTWEEALKRHERGTGARRKHNLAKFRLVDGGGEGGGKGMGEESGHDSTRCRACHVDEGTNQRGRV